MGKIKKDSLGDRQKQYEAVQEHYLVPKMPFIVRVDGKAFHTYTRGFKKPFDSVMGEAMKRTMKSLCKDIPGAVFGYTQSDEITVVCKYTDRIKSQAWFGGRVEKIIAITASKATKYFNKYFSEEVNNVVEKYEKTCRKAIEINRIHGRESEIALAFRDEHDEEIKEIGKLYKVYYKRMLEAEFDSRVFNIPEWDCINNIIWRQQDAIRNSVEAVGQANFSSKELNKVTCEIIKDKLYAEKGIVWEIDFTPYQKRGSCAYKQTEVKVMKDKIVNRNTWVIDDNMPIIHVNQTNRIWFKEITGLSED